MFWLLRQICRAGLSRPGVLALGLIIGTQCSPFAERRWESVTNALRQVIERAERYTVQTASGFEQVLREYGRGWQTDTLPATDAFAAENVPDERVLRRRLEAERTAARLFARPSGLLVCLAVVLGLPLAAMPLVQRGLNRESNGINLAMLLGLTTTGSIAAWALAGLRIDTGVGSAVLVLTVGLGPCYNWWLLSKLEELRT